MAFIKFLSKLFTKHPYGLRSLGEKSSVKSLTRRDLTDYYRHLVQPEEIVISIVGDVSPEEVIKFSKDGLKFPQRYARKFPVPKAEQPPGRPITIEHKRPQKEQAHIVIGFLGPTINSKDHYAIAVLNNILSGQGGRLFLRLRDQMSLAYAVSSTYFAGPEPGYFAVYIGTEPSKVETAITGIMKEFRMLLKDGVTHEELTRSKNHLIGSYELERQRSMNLASNYAFNILFRLGLKEVEEFPKKIEAVGRADIAKAAKRYFRLKAPITSIIRPS